MADKDDILARYGDQTGPYVKFRSASGGVYEINAADRDSYVLAG